MEVCQQMNDQATRTQGRVYISYAPQDREAAVILCSHLSNFGLDYYPNPETRELDNFDWNSSSSAAIHNCDYFALIHSSYADASSTVQKELRGAEHVPRRGWVLLDRVEPQPVFRFRLGMVNACLAYDGDRGENIARFALSIEHSLQSRLAAYEATKPQVFISYSREDKEAVDLLCQELSGCNLTYFRDTESIDIGTDAWERRTAQAIRDCSYFIVVHSTAANRSDWVRRELSYARNVRRGWIRLDNKQPDPVFEFHLGSKPCLASTGNREEKIKEFARSISRALSPVEESVLPVGLLKHDQNPYLGHRSYEDADAGRLLGRDSEIGTITQAIYDSVHRAHNATQPTDKRLFFVYGPSGTGKSSLITAGVLPALRSRFSVIGPLRPRELERTLAEYAAEAKGKPCIIALDQFEEVWPDYDKAMSKDILARLGDLKTLLRGYRNLVVMLSFREEYLAKVQRSYENERAYWNPQVVRGLTESVARDCMRGPAKDIGVEYAEDVLNALSKALLTAEDQFGGDGDRAAYVEPVQLQLLCRELWDNLPEGISTIHASHLHRALQTMLEKMDEKDLKSSQITDSDVNAVAEVFATRAIEGFLTGEIAKISLTPAAQACRYDKVDRINFALLQFIDETNKRVYLKIHWEGGAQWVGRLPIAIVNEFERQHLLRMMYVHGDCAFELMHDRLVGPIASKKEHLGLLYSVNSLDSAMTKVKNDRKTISPAFAGPDEERGAESQQKEDYLQGWFESYEPLIKDLDTFKDFEGLKADEAEFVFRSALAYGKDKEDELKEWAETVSKQHPTRLANVLRDAFAESQTNARVRINGAILLRQGWLQKALGPSGLSEMLLKVCQACDHANKRLDAGNPQRRLSHQSQAIVQEGQQPKRQKDLDNPIAELEELCHTLATCPVDRIPNPASCQHLKTLCFKQDGRSRPSRRILLWMRDKANMRQPSCFVRYWKALSGIHRAVLTLQLFLLRVVHTGFRILCISIVGAIVTAIGAAVMYALCGLEGASFTQNSSASGFTQGLFHGFFGGITWGFALSLSTLIYWLIFRGRRIEPKLTSHWLGGILFSGLAGLAGGFLLARMILGVDDPVGLQSAGWLKPGWEASRYSDAFLNSHAGFIFPIYGVLLGLGVGWSMLSLHHDSDIKQLMSDEKNSEKTVTMFRTWTRTILRKALLKSGPYALGMALAGVAMFFLFQTGHMDCAPKQFAFPESRCQNYDRNPNNDRYSSRDDLTAIAPLELRALGTSLIIYTGALSLTVGYLLALLAIRFGVEIPEDKNFAPLGEPLVAQTAVSFVEDPQPVPAPRQTVPG
jgi:conflict system STAND superfamily ATPase/TIR domain-containing protein